MANIIYLYCREGEKMDSTLGGNENEWNNIKNTVTEVLKLLDNLELPIDPVEIANAAGINVYKNKFKLCGKDIVAGALVKEKNGFNIYVNEFDCNEMQRFTIAHELGHFYLHLNKYKEDEYIDLHYDTEFLSDDILEIEANEFAASILMPMEAVVDYYNKIFSLGVSKSCIIHWLSGIFKVSVEAMHYRLKKLNLM